MVALKNDTIKVLIADDHRVLLDGLVSVLKSEKNINVAATAEDGTAVLELLGKNDYDLCLLDISMPGADGIELTRWIRQNKPDIKIIILTTHDETEIIAELVKLGTSGYLLKSCTRTQLVEAIEKVHAGKTYFNDTVYEVILKGFAASSKTATQEIQLTSREKEIVKLLSQEYTNEKIAAALNISYRTVETHRKNIMQKTGAGNLAGLIKYAFSHGLLNE
ncbi:MAG: response regulator transcription factor [Chitinophagaceae bacterium]|nr:response regulator transcription factor [Chitinophagaceae bacterium]